MKTDIPIPQEAIELENALAPLGLAIHYSPRAPLIWRGLVELYGDTLFDRPLPLNDQETFEQLLDSPIMGPR